MGIREDMMKFCKFADLELINIINEKKAEDSNKPKVDRITEYYEAVSHVDDYLKIKRKGD